MSDFKRFDMETVDHFGEMFDELVERDDGKWMLFDDHATAVDLLRAEIAALKAALQRCHVAMAWAKGHLDPEQNEHGIAAINHELEACDEGEECPTLPHRIVNDQPRPHPATLRPSDGD